MDALPKSLLNAMGAVTDYVYDCTTMVLQDTDEGYLEFRNSIGHLTKMNCNSNSVSETIRQWANHIADNTLFSCQSGYEI